MTHLLAIAVGPVQEFIAAARRTRDLWFGSNLLSEVSRAVAKAVEQHGKLIFPASSEANNVANVILVELTAGADPRDIAVEAKKGAQKQWCEVAEEARGEASWIIREAIWEDQVGDVIEFYAAWVLRSDNYQRDRSRVMRLLAGRKNCRDFLPAKGRAGVPKSSLDGQRESVLLQPPRGVDRKEFRADWPKSLRLSSGEELDVIGITKRLAGGTRPYPSVARVAAETWLSGVNKKSAFDELQKACTAVPGLNRVAEECYRGFPYEGTIIFQKRFTDLATELGEGVKEPLKWVAAVLDKLGGEPLPYLAILVADGDGMGSKLSTLESPEKHREFSGKLASFAVKASAIVEGKSGVLIYAGGDDVLAFSPVHTCLECARELRNRFHEATGMTLSVGIAIGHFMENLEDLLQYGHDAEKAAKKVEGKDALAVHLHKRGGAPIEIAASWKNSPEARLTRFANMMNEGIIPTKLPYELRSMASLYERWTGNADAAIQQDLYRLIAKKASRGVDTVRQALSEDLQAMNSARLLTLGQELLVARQIATALRQAEGRSIPARETTS